MDKEQLINSFNSNALAYDKYRPTYPQILIEDLLDLSRISIQDKILEIGCGTGQISMEFIQRGYDLTAIEKGAALAELAHKKFNAAGIGEVVHSDFEKWETSDHFKLILSAQAFHWIDLALGVEKILELLEDNGYIALIWNIDKSQETAFWKSSGPIYDRYFPPAKSQMLLGTQVNIIQNYLDHHPGIKILEKRIYPWEKCYTKESYLGLLQTFSGHIALPDKQRAAFFKEIAALIERSNNQVLKTYDTVLLFAERLENL